jgi:hypothetical protein
MSQSSRNYSSSSSISQSKDLDINNYDYVDVLSLFGLDYDFSDNSLNVLEQKIRGVNDEIPSIYHPFFMQAYKLVKCMFALNREGVINTRDVVNINVYAKKIKQIPSYESLDVEKLIEKLDISSNFSANRVATNRMIKEPDAVNHVMSSYPNPVAPGFLNSIKRLTQYLNLNLNTCFRNNYYSSNPCDFQYFLPLEIKHVIAMRLASIEIPNSWYVFSSAQKNNTFVIEINNNGFIISFPIVIPDGNYDNDTLQYYLNNTFFYLSGAVNDLIYIEFSIDPYSFKSEFKSLWVLPTPFSFSIKFLTGTQQNIMSTIGWALGYRLANYVNIFTSIVSEGLFDAGGDRYIYVSIDDYQRNRNSLNVVCFADSTMEQNIIAKIPMTNGKLSLTVDDSGSPLVKNRRYNGPVNIRNMHIRILDRFGEVINLNNMDFSFTLELEILYEGFNFKDVNA